MKINCSKALATCKSAITKVDIVRRLCNHFIGEEHSMTHRRMVGTVVMILGVGIAEGGAMIPVGVIHFSANMVGFLIHSIGGIPFIDTLIQFVTKNSDQPNQIINNQNTIKE